MPTELATYSLTRPKTALAMVLAILACSIPLEQLTAQNRAGRGKKALRNIDKQKHSLQKQTRATVNRQLQAGLAGIDDGLEPVPIDTPTGRLQANPPRPERICYEALGRRTAEHNAILYLSLIHI